MSQPSLFCSFFSVSTCMLYNEKKIYMYKYDHIGHIDPMFLDIQPWTTTGSFTGRVDSLGALGVDAWTEAHRRAWRPSPFPDFLSPNSIGLKYQYLISISSMFSGFPEATASVVFFWPNLFRGPDVSRPPWASKACHCDKTPRFPPVFDR